MAERLQNILAKRGIASRRHAAMLIADGRVAVNGQTVFEPGFRVDSATDHITLDGAEIPRNEERLRTILLNKPRGMICSADSGQGRTVCDLFASQPERLVPVGRLDKESEGLLLMSNDGELINHLTHPRFGQTKRYEVVVTGKLTPSVLSRLNRSMVIDGYEIRPCEVRRLTPSGVLPATLEFVLHEGRNRQIRKMCEEVGLRVRSLRRTAIGTLTDFQLKPGEWRDLLPGELRLLRETHQLPTSLTKR